MMSWLRLVVSKIRAMARKDRLDREFDEEIATHLALSADRFQRDGLTENDARYAALRKLGRPESLREEHRDQRGLPLVDTLAQDIKYGLRMLGKSPAFTLVVTLSLALGIGANTALFSLVDGLLIRSLPVRDPDSLAQVQMVAAVGGGLKKASMLFDQSAVDSIRGTSQMVEQVVGFVRLDRPTVAVDGALEPSREVQHVSPNFFRDLGVVPTIGRAPESSDDSVAVISASWWRSRFGGRVDVLGRSIDVNGKPSTIIGVAPKRFAGFMIENGADVWITTSGPQPSFMTIARLRPGVTAAIAQSAFQGLFLELAKERPNWPPPQWLQAEVLPAGKGLSTLRAQYRVALLSLMVLVTLVLLTTCSNVGNLLVLRNAARRRELTVRAALGAGRSRLSLQFLVESALLAAAGCVAGLFLARWGVSIVLSMLPLATTPDGLAFHMDARILAFAAGLSLLSALLFGAAPAWRATDVDLTGALRTSQGTTSPPQARRLGRLLVGCQVGLSVLLLVGAGLFVKTLRNLSHLDIGYDLDRVLQVSIDTRFAGYKEGQVGSVGRLLLERVGAIAGVQSATLVRNSVMRHSLSRMSTTMDGFIPPRGEMWDGVDVGPEFFETMGIKISRGRAFRASDFGHDMGVFVVNEAFVRRYFPTDDPLIKAPSIIGITPDVKLFGVRDEVNPLMYAALRNEPDRINSLEVRATGDPTNIIPAIRQTIQTINPRLYVGARTLREDVERDMAKERMVASISAFFSLLGLLLASVGLFGVASYTVTQRTKELGIRRALGAGRWSVIRESLRETLVVFGGGLILGTIAAIVAVRFTASMISDLLFGLTSTDAVNIVLAVAIMVGVAAAACTLPGYRATRVDPLAAIREE